MRLNQIVPSGCVDVLGLQNHICIFTLTKKSLSMSLNQPRRKSVCSHDEEVCSLKDTPVKALLVFGYFTSKELITSVLHKLSYT